MNKVILMGRLTRDPEIRYSQGDNAMAVGRITLAVDRRYGRKEEQQADFISCVAFGKTAEFLEQYCQKGTRLVVEGRWQTGSYTNKEGSKVYTNDCVIEHCEFAENKKAGQAQGTAPTTGEDSFMNIPDGIDEKLPFN